MNNQNAFKSKMFVIFTMNKFISILVGLVLLVVVIYAWGANLAGFGNAALTFLKGGIVWAVRLIGLVLVILGISSLKD